MKALKELLQKYEEDLKDYEKQANNQWDTYDSAYFEGVCSAFETVIINLRALIEEQENRESNE